MFEAETANDRARFELYLNRDQVWLEHPELGLVRLGAFGPVCDKLCDFLEQEALA